MTSVRKSANSSWLALAVAIVCSAALALVLASSSAAAVTTPTLFAAQGSSSSSDLYALDPATGAATSIGPIGLGVTGLAYDADSGTLYGVTSTLSPASPRSLITINTDTGAPTVIGSLDAGAGALTIAEIEFDGTGALWGWSESGDHFVEIDVATGAVTAFPNFISTAGDGMAWIPGSDTLWFMPNRDNGNYYSINRTTGEPTSVGTLTGTTGTSVSAAAQSCDGLTTNALVMTNPSKLVTVDYATGTMTDVGSTAISTLDALAWACPGSAPAPTPTPTPTPAAVPPTISGVGHLRVRRCTPRFGRCRVGIKFTLDQAATVTLKITRQYGRRTLRKCSTVNPEIRNKPVCNLNRPTYTKRISGVVGANRYTFRFPRTATLGHYTFTVQANNANGTSARVKSRFILPWG